MEALKAAKAEDAPNFKVELKSNKKDKYAVEEEE